jgi:hypothetical protein
MQIACAVLPPEAFPLCHVFPHYVIKIARLSYKMYVLIFSTTFETFLIVRRLLNTFSKILTHQISQKAVQWEESCFMRTRRQTDMIKLTVGFHNFMNTPTNEPISWNHVAAAALNLLHLCERDLRFFRVTEGTSY